MSGKVYLGDGVYVEAHDHDPETLVLTAENGIRATNTIFLERAVFEALVKYGQAARRVTSGRSA